MLDKSRTSRLGSGPKSVYAHTFISEAGLDGTALLEKRLVDEYSTGGTQSEANVPITTMFPGTTCADLERALEAEAGESTQKMIKLQLGHVS